MESCCLLIGCSNCKNSSFIKQVSQETDTGGGTIFFEAIGNHHHRVTCEIGGQQLITTIKRGYNHHIEILHPLMIIFNQVVPDAVGLDIFHRSDVPGCSK